MALLLLLLLLLLLPEVLAAVSDIATTEGDISTPKRARARRTEGEDVKLAMRLFGGSQLSLRGVVAGTRRGFFSLLVSCWRCLPGRDERGGMFTGS